MYRKTPRTAQFTVKQRRPLYEITIYKICKTNSRNICKQVFNYSSLQCTNPGRWISVKIPGHSTDRCFWRHLSVEWHLLLSSDTDIPRHILFKKSELSQFDALMRVRGSNGKKYLSHLLSKTKGELKYCIKFPSCSLSWVIIIYSFHNYWL